MPAAKSSKKVDLKGGKAPVKKKNARGGKAKKKFYEEIPLIKLNTLSVVSERLRVLASLAKAGLHESLIRCVVKHRSQLVCTRAISKATEAAVVEGYGEEKPHFDLLVLPKIKVCIFDCFVIYGFSIGTLKALHLDTEGS
uniref:40S ribosomal protein S25 n=1 Tax=Ditylenchus dipsaci TaxID=166011 RepID=A0A915DHP9_9BILA